MPNKEAQTNSPLIYLAPMAGISDLPFRELVSSLGVGNVVSEMIASKEIMSDLPSWSKKLKLVSDPKNSIVQLAGCDPYWLSESAKYVASIGSCAVDINMGCPSKRVNRGEAGAALMKNPDLVKRIIDSVVRSVDVPVTLKMRLGWDQFSKNASLLARIAEEGGIKLITIHARTRCQFFKYEAKWSEVSDISEAAKIPIVINGDIICSNSARIALLNSKASGFMVGRGARGKPWILRNILNSVSKQNISYNFPIIEKINLILEHYENMLLFYGKNLGIRLARKHLNWYMKKFSISANFKHEILTSSCNHQIKSMIPKLINFKHIDSND